MRELSARHFSPQLLGLRPDLLFPLPAALVELAALDMRSTPLDRLTAVHDTLTQIETHVRLALGSHNGGKPHGAQEYLGSLLLPSSHEEVLLLLGVLINARPAHLASSLAYMRHFAFSAPPHMRDSLDILGEAASLLDQVHVEKIPWRRPPGDLRLEDLVRIAERLRRPSLTEEEEERVDGREAHWKRVVERLELCSLELTRQQEMAWTKRGEGRSRRGWGGEGRDRLMVLLTLLHNKLLCSSDIRDNVANFQTFDQYTKIHIGPTMFISVSPQLAVGESG
jgi:hypothetical protein